jgi:hypothetical protein
LVGGVGHPLLLRFAILGGNLRMIGQQCYQLLGRADNRAVVPEIIFWRATGHRRTVRINEKTGARAMQKFIHLA